MPIERELAEIHADIKWIRKQIEGLVVDTYKNTKYRIQATTKTSMLHYAVGSGWAFTIALLLYNLLH